MNLELVDYFLFVGSAIAVFMGLVHLAFSAAPTTNIPSSQYSEPPTRLDRLPFTARTLCSLQFSATAQAIVLLGWLIVRVLT